MSGRKILRVFKWSAIIISIIFAGLVALFTVGLHDIGEYQCSERFIVGIPDATGLVKRKIYEVDGKFEDFHIEEAKFRPAKLDGGPFAEEPRGFEFTVTFSKKNGTGTVERRVIAVSTCGVIYDYYRAK